MLIIIFTKPLDNQKDSFQVRKTSLSNIAQHRYLQDTQLNTNTRWAAKCLQPPYLAYGKALTEPSQ
jgi:hypothetical protein